MKAEISTLAFTVNIIYYILVYYISTWLTTNEQCTNIGVWYVTITSAAMFHHVSVFSCVNFLYNHENATNKQEQSSIKMALFSLFQS